MIKSPCVKLCELDQNFICIGCFRVLEEIRLWKSLSNSEKQEVLEDVARRKEMYQKQIK